MSELVLVPAITKTDISAPAINNNLDALEAVINGAVDGAFNLAPGVIGASSGTDLNAHIAGSGIALSTNALSVSGAGTGNFAAAAGITPGQLALGGLTALAPNVSSGIQDCVVSNTNSSGSLALLRFGIDYYASTTFGEGLATFSSTLTSTTFCTVLCTFTTAFAAAPLVFVGYNLTGDSTLPTVPPFVSAAGTTSCTIKFLEIENLSVIALGVV